MKTDVIIIDAKYFAHRFFGRNLTSEINGKIVRTDIPYGAFVGMISFFIQHKPKYGFILSWDGFSDDLEKRKIDKTYKAHRSEQEKTFYEQIDLFVSLAMRLGIPQFIDSDWESDDLMGSMVKKRKDINWSIHTSDKDLYQTISKNTNLLKPNFKGKKRTYDFYGLKELKEDLNVTPREYYLMKLITGCKGDNVIGIKGIGEKTALKIVKKCKNIEDIIKSSKNQSHLVQKKILDGIPIMELNQKLVNIKRNIKLTPMYKKEKINKTQLTKLLKAIRFNSMLRKYNLNCLLEINQCGIKAYDQKIWRSE